MLRRDIKAALIAGKNVSSRNAWSELGTMMRIEGEIMGRERQRNLVLESQWPTYKEGPWMDSPLALVKDLEPDNFECDACLRYNSHLFLPTYTLHFLATYTLHFNKSRLLLLLMFEVVSIHLLSISLQQHTATDLYYYCWLISTGIPNMSY